jgi:hypothetical protein
MPKIPCKKYLRGSEKQVRGSCQKLAIQIKKM